ncbi:LAFE_0B08196g1_1 [Lachancea fermentati]|uniref:LAFE_0B08196g1_1 n=1 Tax=Lachancea fermentati TaxID=4955 RepID=A0A1G4M871_LACFM|nr:LAFE_0B08196g1_1 [Lachancea fermentati]
MSAILSDDEEGNISISSQSLEHFKATSGNHMARINKRWSSSSSDKRPKLARPTDAVHENITANFISPGQLYSTESGRLFHAGKILIVLVGLPATSKTLLSVAITRYTKWLGVRTRSFHVSEYRRQKSNADSIEFPNDYFSAKPTTERGRKVRKETINQVLTDMIAFFDKDEGQLAIYDALNILEEERSHLDKLFLGLNIKVLFIESVITDPQLIKHNVEMASKSADYQGWTKSEAKSDFMNRLMVNKKLYEEMKPEENLSYLKYINFGEKLIVNNNHYGYLINKIVFFLMNLRDKKGCVYFARCGTSDQDNYIDDEVLNVEGIHYSKVLTDLVLKTINSRRISQCSTPVDVGSWQNSPSSGPTRSASPLIPTSATLRRSESTGNTSMRQPASGDGGDEDSFVVWTAPRKRTYDTAMFFIEKGVNVRQCSQLQQLHPGVVADVSEDEIKHNFPEEYKECLKDPYHYRYPRAESYHDLAVRMEPLLLEMERMRGDILIIGHESTLRVLYGYLMACSCSEIPSLKFTRNELIEISFSPYENKVRRIPIPINQKAS